MAKKALLALITSSLVAELESESASPVCLFELFLVIPVCLFLKSLRNLISFSGFCMLLFLDKVKPIFLKNPGQ